MDGLQGTYLIGTTSPPSADNVRYVKYLMFRLREGKSSEVHLHRVGMEIELPQGSMQVRRCGEAV